MSDKLPPEYIEDLKRHMENMFTQESMYPQNIESGSVFKTMIEASRDDKVDAHKWFSRSVDISDAVEEGRKIIEAEEEEIEEWNKALKAI